MCRRQYNQWVRVLQVDEPYLCDRLQKLPSQRNVGNVHPANKNVQKKKTKLGGVTADRKGRRSILAYDIHEIAFRQCAREL